MTRGAIRPAYLLVLLGSLLFWLSVSLARAGQEPHPAAPAEHGTTAPPTEHQTRPAGEHAATPGQEKSHSEKGWGVWDTIGKVVNFLILAGVLGFALKGPTQQFVAQRGETIQRKLIEAQRARDEAQSKLEEVQKAMARLDHELLEIKAQAEKDAAAERDRILQTAQEDAAKILEMTRREIDNQMRAARAELKSYAAELTVGLAEEMIKREISPEDDQNVFRHFLGHLKSGNGSVH